MERKKESTRPLETSCFLGRAWNSYPLESHSIIACASWTSATWMLFLVGENECFRLAFKKHYGAPARHASCSSPEPERTSTCLQVPTAWAMVSVRPGMNHPTPVMENFRSFWISGSPALWLSQLCFGALGTWRRAPAAVTPAVSTVNLFCVLGSIVWKITSLLKRVQKPPF